MSLLRLVKITPTTKNDTQMLRSSNRYAKDPRREDKKTSREYEGKEKKRKKEKRNKYKNATSETLLYSLVVIVLMFLGHVNIIAGIVLR